VASYRNLRRPDTERTKPNDLPVEEISRFELVIHLREAGALGIEIPQALLMRTEEIIR
jgi:putative ABC transport system substrate-binding protein